MAIVNAAEAAPVAIVDAKQTPDEPIETEEVEETEDLIEDEFSLMIMKIVGVVVIVFSIIELGVGASAFGALQSVKYGGWWICLVSVPAGGAAIFANKRTYVMGTAILAVLAAVLSFISTIIDGIGGTALNKLTTCSGASVLYYQIYGGYLSPKSAIAGQCLIDFYRKSAISTYKTGFGCSCITDDAKDCFDYWVSYPATTVKTCDDLMKSFPKRVDASAVFSAFLLLLTIALSVVSIMILACPAGVLGGNGKTEEVPNNQIVALPDNGLVGVNGNTDAV